MNKKTYVSSVVVCVVLSVFFGACVRDRTGQAVEKFLQNLSGDLAVAQLKALDEADNQREKQLIIFSSDVLRCVVTQSPTPEEQEKACTISEDPGRYGDFARLAKRFNADKSRLMNPEALGSFLRCGVEVLKEHGASSRLDQCQ